MSSADNSYVRLTRNAAGLGAYSSLWLGEDHVMVVVSTGYTDSYSRMQLRDIKGFFITAGARRLWWGLWWGAIAGLAGILVADAVSHGRTPIVSAFFLSVGVAGLIWNHALGPGCCVYVVTGVQTARLPALVRRKKAAQVLNRLQPRIEAAQADLTAVAAAPGAAPPTVAPPVPAARVLSSERGDAVAERGAAATAPGAMPPVLAEPVAPVPPPPPFPPDAPPA